MNYELRWHDEHQQILLVAINDEITYEMLYQMFEDCADSLDTVTHPVAVVFDLSNLKLVFKVDITALGKITRMRFTTHPNRLCSYFANPNLRSRVIIDVARRMFPRMMQTVYTSRSLDEALAAVEQMLAEVTSSSL
jgi:hypothetical protein